VTDPVIGVESLDEQDALALLTNGEMELEGLLVNASNTTIRAVVTYEGVSARCVYKPVEGERPLWDFPDGTLAGREVSAYLVSQAAGLGLVPPTVMREGPLGPGACQLWIEEDTEAEPLVGFVTAGTTPDGWCRVATARGPRGRMVLAHADDPRLVRMCIFDAVINNADRKGGHLLRGVGDTVYGVDHGICFHAENKLRTVLWGWAGSPLNEPAQETLAALREAMNGGLRSRLAAYLTRHEIRAMEQRLERLSRSNRFPQPNGDWPALPWPPI